MLLETLRAKYSVKTLVMGIVNVTPDSFFDGGQFGEAESATAHARELAAQGAHILDIGGESSRPGAAPVSPEEECRRVLPVVEALCGTGLTLSIDTYHADTARHALAAGAHIINDITALRHDPAMAGLVAGAGCECVLMHMQGAPQDMQRAPQYADVVDEIAAFFEERLAFAVKEGIREEAIWLDPGFGFGKTVAHNLVMLKRLHELVRLGRPLLVGTSNKSTIGTVLDLPPDQRVEGTAATVAVSIMNGADAVRVHDVRAMGRVARMTDAIRYQAG